MMYYFVVISILSVALHFVAAWQNERVYGYPNVYLRIALAVVCCIVAIIPIVYTVTHEVHDLFRVYYFLDYLSVTPYVPAKILELVPRAIWITGGVCAGFYGCQCLLALFTLIHLILHYQIPKTWTTPILISDAVSVAFLLIYIGIQSIPI